MRLAAAASVLLHGLAVSALLAHWQWREQPAPSHEAAARIEMMFGKNALKQGAPSSHARSAVPVPPAAPSDPSPPAATGVQQASAPSVRTEPLAAPPAADQPVRLGDGLVGFDVPIPDPGIVEAQSDPGNRPPRYPEAAWARREHGRVVLRIHVRPDGLVEQVETLQSSGFADLDEAAANAARRWRFIPQLRDGAAVASTRDQAMDFILE